MELTVARTTYGPFLRTVDRAVRLGARLGLAPAALDADAVLAAAERATGLHDHGSPEFREPLELAIATGRTRPFTALGRLIVERTLVQAATNRLRLVERRRHGPLPAVERPVFVLGFPRTGTTVLHNLLALHPDRRAPEFWELTQPFPVDADPVRDASRRIASARRVLQIAYLASPELRTIHRTTATTIEECWPLFCPSFTVLNWDLGMGLQAYGDWLLRADLRSSYTDYRDLLGVLSEQRPAGRYVLKCPEHLWFLDALFEVFPDARVVWTHRDPLTVVASYCSMMSLQWRSLYGRFDPEALGTHITRRFVEGVTRAQAVRDQVGQERFVDVCFDDLVADPLAVLRSIEARFDLDPVSEAAVERHLGVRLSDASGRHRYDPALYGLTADGIRAGLGAYAQTYGVG